MITQKLVRETFKYDDGNLIRKIARSHNPKSKIGNIIGNDNGNRYLVTEIEKKHYRVHRLIFLYHHGYLPKYLDHINGNRQDNRIENLRECTINQNAQNRKARKGCSSKHKGVSWSKEKRLWEAYINTDKKRIQLGRFWDEETASQAVRILRIKSHGEFAKHG